MRRSVVFAAISLSAACASAPTPPDLRAPNAGWTEADAADIDAAADDAWWRGFNDPVLNALIERVEEGDDVELAGARLDEALAGLRSARAELLPTLSGTGTVSMQRAGDEAPRVETASGGAGASWTPDLFGQARLRASAAARFAGAGAADLAAVRLDTRRAATLLYVAVRSAQGQARAAEKNAASLREALDLVESRATAGLAPDFDVAQAEAALAAAEARPPALRRAEASARLSLEALIGAAAGTLRETLDADGAVPPPPASEAMLPPAAVLAQRPDLQAAAERFDAAGYDARAARRDFWPTVSLSALVGGQSSSPVTAISGPGLLYNAASGVTAPIFTFGRLEAARDRADARLDQAMIGYRRQATYALADVERALAARKDAAARQEALSRALAAARDQAALAQDRYVAGLSPLLDVLVAERAVFDAEAALVVATADAAIAYADLNAAMGLGADPLAPSVASR